MTVVKSVRLSLHMDSGTAHLDAACIAVLKDVLDRVTVVFDNTKVSSTGSGLAAANTDQSRITNPTIYVSQKFLISLGNGLIDTSAASILLHEILHLVSGLKDKDPKFDKLLDKMYGRCNLTNRSSLGF